MGFFLRSEKLQTNVYTIDRGDGVTVYRQVDDGYTKGPIIRISVLELSDVTWLGGHWSERLQVAVVVGIRETKPIIYTSCDLITWVARSLPEIKIHEQVVNVLEIANCICVYFPFVPNVTLYSIDSIVWSILDNSSPTWTGIEPSPWAHVCWSHELSTFIVAGADGTLYRSANGASLTPISGPGVLGQPETYDIPEAVKGTDFEEEARKELDEYLRIWQKTLDSKNILINENALQKANRLLAERFPIKSIRRMNLTQWALVAAIISSIVSWSILLWR